MPSNDLERFKQITEKIKNLGDRIWKLECFLHKLKDEREELLREHHSLDHKLAMEDGRFQKVKVKTENNKPRPKPQEYAKTSTDKILDNLSKDQLQMLADKLGFTIDK